MSWPFPGDSPVARARRVAHAYRAALEAADPGACTELDRMVTNLGQGWAVPAVIVHDPEEWLSVSDSANLACVDPATLRQYRLRGLLKGRINNGKWQYQYGEITKLFSGPRRRNGGVTDTVIASGTRVPNDK